MTAVLDRARSLPGWARSALIAAVLVAVLSVTVTLTGQTQLTSGGTASAAVRLGLPILLAGLGGLWAERAGIINIGLEGMMVLGTWGAAWAGYQWGPWAAMLGGLVFGALGGLLHAVATVTFNVNHIVSGVAITLLGTGLTKYLATLVFTPVSQNPRQSPRLEGFTEFSIPGVSEGLAALEAQQRVFVSDLAGLLSGLVTGLTPILVIGVALVPVSYLVLWRTAFGLRLRSAGESPVAAESLGVNVVLHKYVAVTISGALAGLGGAALVLNPGQLGYLENQVGGRGYIGLAAMIFGNWRPGGLLAGSGLFGYTQTLGLRQGGTSVHALLLAVAVLATALAGYQLWRKQVRLAVGILVAAAALITVYAAIDVVPGDFVNITPYVVTLLVLAFASQRLRMPAADGQVYRRGSAG